MQEGERVEDVARSVKTTTKRLSGILTAVDPVSAVFGVSLQEASLEKSMGRARRVLGQLLLGELAELAFEEIYKTTMGTEELAIEDDRASRNDTDYRVLNGAGRPAFRINIKFHGTLFRKAKDLVGLEPEDCFALATYKIYQGLQKQNDEHLPYIFVIVSAPGLTGEAVGAAIPEDLVHLVSLVQISPRFSGKRTLEESAVRLLLQGEEVGNLHGQLHAYKEAISKAEWRILSARRAAHLLVEKLFDRVYAVRVRGFARHYPNAELDMHFSLESDLTRLADFLHNLRERGLHGLTVELERGVF
jgi:hypothetical protein